MKTRTETRNGKEPATHSGWLLVLAVQVAVEVGFEPTEGLPPHTLLRSAARRSPQVGTVRELALSGHLGRGEQSRTLANETSTETR